MNSGFLITDSGLAAATIATPTGPYINIAEFKVGDAVNYTPDRSMTDLQGTILHTGIPSSYTVISADTIEVMLIMDATVGSFQFGEIGLYLNTGELFAVSVFETLQDKIRAVGNQAGTTWRIRARLKLAQAPVLVNVTVQNGQSILEVPNWQSLLKPADQISNANIVIVHANNSHDDPVLVVRDNDNEWGLVDYSRVFSGASSDAGASLTSTTFTHPDLVNIYFEDMPRADSRYLIKFANGQIRQITNTNGLGQVTFSPANSILAGPISIWEEGGGGQRISWADTTEYNALALAFNPHWGKPVGPHRVAPDNAAYPAANRGIGQTEFAQLTRRTNTLDWLTFMTAVRAKCRLHSVPVADIADITDFVYRPVPPHFYSMESLRVQYQALLAKPALLQTNRNIYDWALFEQLKIGEGADNVFWRGTRTWRFSIAYVDEAHLQASLNAGCHFSFVPSVTNINNGDWHEIATLLNAANPIILNPREASANAGTGSSNGIQVANTTAPVTFWTYTANNWTVLLRGWRATVGPVSPATMIFEFVINNIGTNPYDTPALPPGEIKFEVLSRRPQVSLINSPGFAHPTLTFAIV